jgi:hypothetical protein
MLWLRERGWSAAEDQEAIPLFRLHFILCADSSFAGRMAFSFSFFCVTDFLYCLLFVLFFGAVICFGSSSMDHSSSPTRQGSDVL